MTILATTPPEPAPVAVRGLIAGAWREAHRVWPTLWPLWLTSGMVTAAIELTFRLLRPAGTPPGGVFTERLANVTLSAAGLGTIAALALPVLLRHRETIGRLGPELAAYVRGYVLLTVGMTLADEGLASVLPTPLPLLVIPLGLAILFVANLALAPWVLWNVSQLPGAGRLTVADAWRIGPGGAWAYAVAFCAVASVPVLACWVLKAMFEHSGDLITLALACGVGVLVTMWDTAVAAVFFRQRLGLERPETLADVFD